MAIGPVPPLVSTISPDPLPSLGRAAGFGFIVASSLTCTPTSFAAEYQHGTHAQAIYDSQFKGAIFGAAKGQVPVSAVKTVYGAPQAIDLTQQGWFSSPIENESLAVSSSYTFGLHQTQIANSQIGAQVFPSASKAPAIPGVGAFLTTVGQELKTDLTIQGWTSIPSVPQGWLLTYISAGPQVVDLTLPASTQKSLKVNIQAPYCPTTIVSVSQDDLTQIPARIIRPPSAASPKPVLQTFVAQSPDPTQLQPQIFPALVVRVVNYRIARQFITPPQEYTDVPQGQLAEPLVGQLPNLSGIIGQSFSFSVGTVTPSIQKLIGIYDYFTLGQALLDFSHRTDIANFQDYYIQQAETRIYRDLFAENIGNGVKWLEQPLLGTITNGVLAVPANYFALKTMQLVVGQTVTTLEYSDPQWIYQNYAQRQPQGHPRYVARDGTNFIFGPYPDSGFTISGTYYGSSTPLSATAPLNWMTNICPDLLLASCMLELQPFLKDSDAMKSWSDIYQAKMRALLDLDQAERMSPGTLTMET